MIDHLVAALRSGQVERLLAPGAVLVSDGGGQVAVPLQPVHGAGEIARVITVHCTRPGADLSVERANGRPAIVVRRSGQAQAVLCLDVADEVVTHLWLILNPAKLTAWHRDLPPADDAAGHTTDRRADAPG
jgi:RNA polymerase sigma-70 factor (ECF subfamily)